MARGAGNKKFIAKTGGAKRDRAPRPSEVAAKNKKTQKVAIQHDEEFKAIPKSIIIKRGKLDQSFRALMHDFRTMFEPHSSKALVDTKRHHIKDFIDAAHIFAASHLQIFSHTLKHAFWKVGCLPKGPQLVFSIQSYSLAKDVRKTICGSGEYLNMKGVYLKPAVCVLNGFGKVAETNPRIKVAQSMLLNMFPKVNYETAKLGDIKRAVFISLDAETEIISLRQYLVKSTSESDATTTNNTVGIKLAEIGPSVDMKLLDVHEEIQLTSDNRPKISGAGKTSDKPKSVKNDE